MKAAKEASEAAAARAREALDLKALDSFPAACGEMEKALKDEKALMGKMRALKDSFCRDGKGGEISGEEVVTQVRDAGEKVMLQVRKIMQLHTELGSALHELEAAAAELRAGVALAQPGGMQGGVQRLKRMLDAQKEEKRQVRKKDVDLQRVRLDSPGERQRAEVARLERELLQMKENAVANDYPAKIARERARLLSHASLHFPELLWEGGEFLQLARQDVQEVAQQRSLLSAGVLLQGRSSVRDFREECVLSEPSPQTGSLARVTACTDMQGKSYQLGAAGAASAAVGHFYRQVAMLHELQHTHLVPVVAVWQEGDQGFTQMPWYPGGDLAAWMGARPVEGGRDAAASLRLAEDLLSALAFLHEKGKVHCDVKPQNIFLTESGRGVLGDFDGVKDAGEDGRPRATTILHVTAHYLAPEVRAGGGASTASDVYSAGVILEELLGGGVLSGDSQRSEALAKLLSRMRSDTPSERPTAAEILQDPLFSRETVENAQCVTCFEILLKDRGLVCASGDASQRHFLCAECLNAFVQSQSTVDPEYSDVRARFKANDCRVSCVAPGCPSDPFPHADLARHLRSEVLQLCEDARREAAEERVRAEMETEFEERLRRALREDGAQRKVREIAEDILTLKCPRCRTAFIDFNGCAALTCARCNCGFCGYCQMDCGHDAHDHVPRCPLGVGMFVPIEQWEGIQREQKGRKVRELLGRLGVEDRAEVLRLLRPLLEENEIPIPSA